MHTLDFVQCCFIVNTIRTPTDYGILIFRFIKPGGSPQIASPQHPHPHIDSSAGMISVTTQSAPDGNQTLCSGTPFRSLFTVRTKLSWMGKFTERFCLRK